MIFMSGPQRIRIEAAGIIERTRALAVAIDASDLLGTGGARRADAGAAGAGPDAGPVVGCTALFVGFASWLAIIVGAALLGADAAGSAVVIAPADAVSRSTRSSRIRRTAVRPASNQRQQ